MKGQASAAIWLRPLLLASVVALFALVALASSAQAQYSCPSDNPWCGCVDNFQSDSVCTAEDVRVASLAVHQTIDTCGHPGDTGRFVFEVNAVAGANERYDIGFFIGLDGGSAQLPSRLPGGASCYHGYLPPPLSSIATPLGEIRYSPFFDAEVGGDTCGDVEQGVMNSYLTEQIDVLCVDNDDDGVVDDVSTCVSWDNQKNQTPICTDVSQAYPNTKSKCNCEDVPIPTLVIRKIVVDKVTDPPNDPTLFGFTLTGPDVNVAFDLTDAETPFISGLLARQTYAVAETVPEGWVQTNVVCTNGLTTFQPSAIGLTENREVRCTFYNKKLEGGGKFVDLNWNGQEDAGDPLKPNWPIRITSVADPADVTMVSTRTGDPDAGKWFFPADLPPGQYDVEEVNPPERDWIQTYPDTNGGMYRIQYNGAQWGEGPDFEPLFELLSPEPASYHELDFGNVWVDFGDLPDSNTLGTPYATYYPTMLLPDDGARHVVRDIQLGEALTAEIDGQPCPVCGLDADDGVVRTNLPWIIGPAGGAVEVRVTAIGSAGVETGYVNAWIDWNQNGQMDAAEQILFDAPVPVGTTQTLTFDIPDGVNLLQDIYYARFRLYSTPQMLLGSGALPTGVAYDGEVEDYRWEFIPTAVTLAAFDAQPDGAGVLVTWQTVSEIDNAGFNLYRTGSASAQPEPAHLLSYVPSQAPGSTQGAFYSYFDGDVEPSQTYWYWLEDVSLSGTTTLHGPVSATVQAPTGVTLSGISASPAAGSMPAAGVLLALLAPLAGAVWALRRRP